VSINFVDQANALTTTLRRHPVLKVHYLTNTLYLYLSTFLEYLRHH